MNIHRTHTPTVLYRTNMYVWGRVTLGGKNEERMHSASPDKTITVCSLCPMFGAQVCDGTQIAKENA